MPIMLPRHNSSCRGMRLCCGCNVSQLCGIEAGPQPHAFPITLVMTRQQVSTFNAAFCPASAACLLGIVRQTGRHVAITLNLMTGTDQVEAGYSCSVQLSEASTTQHA